MDRWVARLTGDRARFCRGWGSLGGGRCFSAGWLARLSVPGDTTERRAAATPDGADRRGIRSALRVLPGVLVVIHGPATRHGGLLTRLMVKTIAPELAGAEANDE